MPWRFAARQYLGASNTFEYVNPKGSFSDGQFPCFAKPNATFFSAYQPCNDTFERWFESPKRIDAYPLDLTDPSTWPDEDQLYRSFVELYRGPWGGYNASYSAKHASEAPSECAPAEE